MLIHDNGDNDRCGGDISLKFSRCGQIAKAHPGVIGTRTASHPWDNHQNRLRDDLHIDAGLAAARKVETGSLHHIYVLGLQPVKA
jgi:hypothetical protein